VVLTLYNNEKLLVQFPSCLYSVRRMHTRCYVIRTDLDQIRRVTDVCRAGRITRFKHFSTDGVMFRLMCLAYTALFCISLKLAPSAETCSSFSGCYELCFIKLIGRFMCS
jgi:hypothetical protein